jgi:mono/diheme cytochrome c family protein
MPDGERDVYLGEATIAKYGCYGCHDIAGFEQSKPIGTELSEEGSKPVHLFDFGHVHDVPHTRPDWIRTKLLRPRVWDHGKELVKDYAELYKMPDFGLSTREADAVLTNVLGFTKESVVSGRRAAQRPSDAQLADGRKLVTRFNCQGCHLIEGEGQAIKTSITDAGLLPPNLAAEGARVQSDWLFSFLHDPSQVRLRPWLTVRMPTFGFNDQQLNSLVSYFAAGDRAGTFGSEPPAGSSREVAVGQVVFGMLQCAKCHPAGAEAAAATGGAAGDLAPSLLLSRERLRHGWVPSWIKDPQSWIPGTRMPSFFPSDGKGHYQSPLSAQTLQAPMFASQRSALLAQFASEAEMDAYLKDPDKVTQALRDYVWSLSAPRSSLAP